MLSRMSNMKRTLLKCFLLLVSSVVVILIYFAYPLRWKERGSSTLVNDLGLAQFHAQNAPSKAVNFDGVSLNVEDEKAVRLSETEMMRESMKLNSIFSKEISRLKASAIAIDSLKSSTDIPVIRRSTTGIGIQLIRSTTLPLLGNTSRSYAVRDDIPEVKVEAVSCAKLILGDPAEQSKADSYQKAFPRRIIPDDQLYRQALNCPAFLSHRKYVLKPVSEEEAAFRIAFSILLFKDVQQFEQLLRAIYRPQNFYCVHVDKKSPKSVQDAVGSIVNCFGNVFLAPEQFDVQWGTFSVLEPEISCMKELLKYKKWKYFINLTGQEFPLKTNWEIVQILKIFNGANNLEGTVKRRNLDRISKMPPTPANITVTKGSLHVIASRKFVRFIIYNETSLKFRDWAKQTSIPDETYFSSLNFNPHLRVPGSYLGIPETDTKKNLFITRFKNWGDGPFDWPCAGQRVRMVCIFAVRDLPLLAKRPELFANKFYLDYEPIALDCLEELHYYRTRLQASLSPDIDRNFYSDLDFVRNHL